MNILIVTCGVGIGHASRDLALAELLIERGHNITFASYGSGLQYYKKNNYQVYSLPPMNFEAEDGKIDVDESLKQSKDIPFTFIKSMYNDAKIIKEINPDLIIADSDYSAPITAKLLNVPCFIITNDLTFGFSNSSDATVTIYFEKTVSKIITTITRGCKSILIPDIPGTVEIPEQLRDKSTFIGPLIHEQVNEVLPKKDLRAKYGFDDDEKIILVTIGGSDFGEILIKNIIEISSQINADKIIIFTGLEVDPDKFSNNLNDKIVIKEFTYNLVNWMQLSDLVIALAGHTTAMELLSIKKPNILIPLENHVEQERNVQRVMDYNITKTTSINDKENLLSLINDTLDHIDEMSIDEEKYNNFIHYNGRMNALTIIENMS